MFLVRGFVMVALNGRESIVLEGLRRFVRLLFHVIEIIFL
jgi:hypothetical protein